MAKTNAQTVMTAKLIIERADEPQLLGKRRRGLGDPARKAIKGNSLDYYLNILHETREKTLAELKKRDDKWLTIIDKEFGANNYGKWFHVAEHESNHDGQIKFLKSRLPGAKPATE